jgi:hypothetical protein
MLVSLHLLPGLKNTDSFGPTNLPCVFAAAVTEGLEPEAVLAVPDPEEDRVKEQMEQVGS